MTFADLGLSPDLLRAIDEAGYKQPTPIQELAIPLVLMGRDVMGSAQTGTGKTASYTLPMIEILSSGRAKARMPRSLILEPTRELAAQVAEAFQKYGKNHGLNHALLIGGESIAEQEQVLNRNIDVLIATPGRLIDLFGRGKILLMDVKILVIDEADRMLDMGFIPDIEAIVALLPKIRQTLFFSATMPPEIRALAEKFLMNPKDVSVAPPASTATTITQYLVPSQERQKREILRHLLRTEEVANAFIFCNRKRDVDVLYKSLTRHGFAPVALHGDMAQSRRTETLEKFRQGDARIMVCSDVAARGIDIAGLSHVFNFDVPVNAEDYVHRIGRTGRAGKEGRAFTLATPRESKQVHAIEHLIGKEIPRLVLDSFASSEPAPSSASPAEHSPQDKPRRNSRRRSKSDPQTPSMAAVPVKEDRATPRPVPSTSESKNAGPARRAAAPRNEDQPISQERSHRHNNRPGNHFAEDDMEEDKPILSFGDHVPAFITRKPPRLPRSRAGSSDE